MNNHVTAFVLSALIHTGLLSAIVMLNQEPIKTITNNKNISLMVSLFKTKTAPEPQTSSKKQPPIKPIKPIKTAVIHTPSPSLAPTQTIAVIKNPIQTIADKPVKPEEPPKPDTQKESRKLASQQEAISKLTALKANTPKPQAIEKRVKQLNNKPLITKKVVTTKKRHIALIQKKILTPKRKKLVKKTQPSKPIRKIVIAKKRKLRVVHKKAIKQHPVLHKKTQRHKIVRKTKLAKIQTPAKHIVAQQKHKKVGGVYLNRQKNNQKNSINGQRTVQTRRVKPTGAPNRYTPPVSATASHIQNTQLTQQYKIRLQKLIAANKRYPRRAKRRGQQGKVTVSFKITHSGIISNIKIRQGSGYKALDIATIKAIKLASGKLHYPAGMSKKSLTLTVTLSYLLS